MTKDRQQQQAPSSAGKVAPEPAAAARRPRTPSHDMVAREIDEIRFRLKQCMDRSREAQSSWMGGRARTLSSGFMGEDALASPPLSALLPASSAAFPPSPGARSTSSRCSGRVPPQGGHVLITLCNEAVGPQRNL